MKVVHNLFTDIDYSLKGKCMTYSCINLKCGEEKDIQTIVTLFIHGRLQRCVDMSFFTIF
jgi:hypothetical protein